ncbi:hypothetical protein [Streptomyces daliensis]|uniref:Uncharacterized protein n=1 Tax=Streptomyces daliensis TaxID=299421 RepID=A0A8T4IKT1_9ACTN|nr:hypothetical protein [Streptomyces daliensis]
MSATQTTMVQLVPLAKELDENKVTPGVLGFLVFAVIGVAVWMLMKSMNRHMNRVDFEEPAAAAGGAKVPAPAAAEGAAATSTATSTSTSTATATAEAEAKATEPERDKPERDKPEPGSGTRHT